MAKPLIVEIAMTSGENIICMVMVTPLVVVYDYIDNSG